MIDEHVDELGYSFLSDHADPVIADGSKVVVIASAHTRRQPRNGETAHLNAQR